MKVGIVGCGEVSTFHFNAWRDAEMSIAAVCDVNKNAAMQAAEKWRIPSYYTDLSRMLQSEDLFAISICTPPQFHADLAVEALKSGCHVVVEKPFTVTTKEVDKVMNTLQKSSAKLTVMHNQLFERSMLIAMKKIKAGSIGEVVGMNVGMVHSKDDQMVADKNHWSHTLPGGRFGETLPHSVYLLRGVLGNLEVKSVFADKLGHCPWMPFDDLRVILQADRKFGTIHISYNAPKSFQFGNVYVDIHGTCGALRAGIYPLNSFLASKPGREIWSSENITQQAKIGFAYLSMLLKRKGLKGLKGFSASHTLIIKSFVKSILSNEEPLVTPEMGYENVRIVEQICRQIEA